jgi:hypothetical protein
MLILHLLFFLRDQPGFMDKMHVGPYSSEPATIERMHEFAAEHGYRVRGKHHEIYLGDPRRAQPEKLNTVLRHPVEG